MKKLFILFILCIYSSVTSAYFQDKNQDNNQDSLLFDTGVKPIGYRQSLFEEGNITKTKSHSLKMVKTGKSILEIYQDEIDELRDHINELNVRMKDDPSGDWWNKKVLAKRQQELQERKKEIEKIKTNHRKEPIRKVRLAN